MAAIHAPAGRLERAACDLFGFTAIDAPDPRRWLDHGRWPVRHPLGRPVAHDGAADAYAFLGAEGAGLHQIPVGPVHAGIIEPGHFRFHAGGEAVVRLEERLGYVHKGVDSLTRGASIERAAILAARVSGDSTVAYSVAFARAVEVRARDRGARARALASRPDGGARAPRQSFRRHRRHLQRRRLFVDARPLRRVARADLARGPSRLRPSADDGRRRAGRRRGRPIRRWDRGDPRPRARGSLDFPKTRPALRQYRLVAGQDGRNRRSERRSRQALRRGRRRWPRVGTRFRRPARSPLSAVRRSRLQGSDPARGRRERPHLGADRRGVREPRPH